MQQKVSENYKKNVDKLSSEDIANIFQKAQTYNENLLGQRLMTLIPGSGIVMPDNIIKF